MRTLLFLLILVPSISFAEHRNLLDCNTSDGPDQQVTVRKEEDGSLRLIELLISGKQVQRSLSQEEWASGILQLQDGEYGEKTTLNRVVDGWWFESIGLIGRAAGYADCWIDKGDL